MEITNGRYRSGKNLQNEVNKTFNIITDNNTSVNEGRALSIGTAHIWPSYIIDTAKGSTFKFTSVSREKMGYTQGDFDFREGRDNAPSLNDIPGVDPAGGHGQIKFMAKESSLWHKLKARIRVTISNLGKDYESNPDCGLLVFPPSMTNKPYRIDFYDKETGEINTETITLTLNRNVSILLDNSNEISNDGTKTLVQEYIIDPLHDGLQLNHTKFPLDKNDNLPKNEEETYYILDYEIQANNEVYKKSGKVELLGYYAYDNGPLDYFPLNEPMLLANWYQLPNILYYVNMAWVQKPNSKTDIPKVITNTSVEYTHTTFDIYLFVELGISPNGGKDIYWNQPINGLSLDASMPEDIARYITIDKPSNTTDSNSIEYNHSSKYEGNFSVSTIWPYGNYVKVTGRSLPNNERNNEERTQRYFIDNLLFDSPSHVNINNKIAGAAVSGPNDELKTMSCTFDVKKYTTTKPWHILINASLQYNKFKGATDGKTFEERK